MQVSFRSVRAGPAVLPRFADNVRHDDSQPYRAGRRCGWDRRRFVGAGLTQQDERARALKQRINRIYRRTGPRCPRFGPARWLTDGTAYTTVERTPGSEGSDIVRYDAATGARSVLI